MFEGCLFMVRRGVSVRFVLGWAGSGRMGQAGGLKR